MSRTLSPSIARGYRLARVARVWQVSRASVYRLTASVAAPDFTLNVPDRFEVPLGGRLF